MKSDESIFLCCSAEFAVCFTCAKSSCPICHRHRTVNFIYYLEKNQSKTTHDLSKRKTTATKNFVTKSIIEPIVFNKYIL